jgi:hypothetical protein
MPTKTKPSKTAAPARVMGDRERQELLDQIEQEKAFQASLGRELPDHGSLGVLGEAGNLGVDKSKIAKRIGKLSKAVAEGEAPVLRGAQRNAALARYKDLEGKLPEVLMTRFDQDQFPRHGHDYHVAVRKAKGEIGNPTIQNDIAEYRRLGRALFPEDPDKSSVERLRKNR